MALYKRPGSKYYWMKFWHNSELIQKSTKIANKKKAEDYERAYRFKLQLGELGIDEIGKKEIPTFEKAVKDFLEVSKIKHANKPRTYERIKYSVQPLENFFGKKRVDKIKKPDVESYLQKRGLEISQKTKEPITRGTINNELIILKMIFSRLVEIRILRHDPAANVKQLKENKKVFHVITSDEETFYLMASPQPLHDIFTLMIECGFRPKELFPLTRTQVNLDQDYIQVVDGKTESSNRKVYLTGKAKKIITDRLARFAGGFLFPRAEFDGNPPVSAGYINDQHLAVMKKVGYHFRMYDARHSCATRLLESGVDLLTLAHILGHSDMSQLMRYAHPSEGRKLEAIRQMEKAKAV